MRRLSKERRQVVVMAGGLAASSGTGMAITNEHPVARWVWLAVYSMLLMAVIVKMLRLRRDGCK